MSREELYALVWQTPLSRLAKSFGLSDVGLRKICAKHNIPTPPVGYWAKLAHGKRVHQPPLKPAEGTTNPIQIVVRATPPSIVAAQDSARAQESTHAPIIVASKVPANCNVTTAITAKALRAAKADHEGFKHALVPGGVDVTLGPDSVDRALCIIDAFLRAAEDRGHTTVDHPQGVRVIVDGVPFAWRLHEVKERIPHKPTKEELRAQARQEEDRARWPSIYSSADTKVYRLWDYFPSGRLGMTFTDGTRYRWGRDGLVGHWHDRKSRRLEEYLNEIMEALVTNAVAIKHRLAEEAERERRRAEEFERKRREQARRERALKRHEFLLKKADEYARYRRMAAFAEFLEREVYQYSQEPVDRLIDEMKSLIEVMGEGFERGGLEEEIVRLQLYSDDDTVVDRDND